MAGDIFLREGTIFTLTSSGSSLTNATAVAASNDLDVRNAGSAGVGQNLRATFELVCQWATVTGIVAGTVATELYLSPALDGTNFPDVDLTASSSFLQYAAFVGNFTCPKVPTVSTNMRLHTKTILLDPFIYRPYILNRSGQTIAATWTLKVMSARLQYT